MQKIKVIVNITLSSFPSGLQGKGGMKTFWLVGKKEGEEATQTFMSMVGGHTTAIGPHCETGSLSVSQSKHSLQPAMESFFEEDETIEEDDDVVIQQKDSPVAYYGHVPHTPHNSNGLHFQWDKVWKCLFIDYIK